MALNLYHDSKPARRLRPAKLQAGDKVTAYEANGNTIYRVIGADYEAYRQGTFVGFFPSYDAALAAVIAADIDRAVKGVLGQGTCGNRAADHSSIEQE